jgi:hypothetical protein
MAIAIRDVYSLRFKDVTDGLFEKGPEARARARARARIGSLFKFTGLGLILTGAVTYLLLGTIQEATTVA